MRYADLVQLYFHQSDTLQTYWIVYVVVIGGLLAVAALRREPDKVAGILATVLFCAFAYKNLGAIHETIDTRGATLAAIQQYDLAGASASDVNGFNVFRQKIAPTLQSPEFGSTQIFHIFCDALTIVTLWALQWRRLVNKREMLANRSNV